MKRLLFIFLSFLAFAIGLGDIARADVTCTGATYYDSDAGECVACPEGFGYDDPDGDGKTSINECQAQCAAGTYFLYGYEQLEYIESSGTQWIDTGYVIGNSGTVSGSVGISSSTDKTGNVGNFAGNQGELNGKAFGGYAVNYKNGVFGLWVNPAASGASGNKATVSANKIAANTLYNLEYTTTTDSSRTFSVNGNNATANLTIASTQSIKSVVSYKLFTNGCRGNGTNQTNEFTCSGAGNTPVPIQMHYVKLYDNGVLVLDLIPVRNKNTNELGMLNKVNGEFYTNAGTGTFTAGNVVNSNVALCVNVGTGYWSAASVTNYGSVGTRNACPAGTYNDTTNATSAAACLPCSGATYNDETAQAACKACPTGYTDNATTGKTAVNQCQISCPAGTWNAAYTRLEYLESGGRQYINTGYKYADESLAKVVIDTSFATGNGSHGTYHNYGLRVGLASSRFVATKPGDNISTDIEAVAGKRYLFTLDLPNTTYTVKDVDNDTLVVDMNNLTNPTTTGAHTFSLFRLTASDSSYTHSIVYSAKLYNDGVIVRDMIPVRRNSDGELGMYDLVNNVFYTNAGYGTFHAGPDVAGSISTDSCTGVGAGYWSNAQMVNYGSVATRTACPAGTSATNGTSAASCTDCTGATYSTGGTACLSCPVDFDYNTTTSGKTTPTQCQAQCAAGTYYNGYTRLEYLESTGVQSIRANWGVSSAEIGTEKIVIDTTFLLSSNATHGRGLNSTNLGPGVGIKNGKLYLTHGTIDGVGNEFISDVTGNIGTRYLFTWDAPNTTFNVRDVENDTTVLNITDVAASNGTASSGVTVFLFGAGFGNNTQVSRNTSRIYSAKFYKNDELQRDFVPVRRDSDGVLGLYDLVNNVFYENFTTDNNTEPFIAGPEVTACWDAEPGYYAVSAVTNYGTAGSRSACPIGTYNNTDNGTSIAACLDCTGATYNDETGQGSCKSCPYGFTYNTTAGKTLVNQCQIQCAAGTWNNGYTRLEYLESTGVQDINTGWSVASADIGTEKIVIDTTFLSSTYATQGRGEYQSTYGPGVGIKNGYLYLENGRLNGASNRFVSDVAGSIGTRYLFTYDAPNTTFNVRDVENDTTLLNAPNVTLPDSYSSSTDALALFAARYGSSDNQVYKNTSRIYSAKFYKNDVLQRDFVPVRRDSDGELGLYDMVNKVFYPKRVSSVASFIAGPEVAACLDAGPGYYAASAVTNYGQTGTQTACPIGTYNPTSGGTSLSSCLSCPGATYNNETAQSACKSCPAGYTTNTTAGKTAENQCQLQCPNGKYNTGYSRVEYLQSSGAAYINTDYAFLNHSTPKIILDMEFLQANSWFGSSNNDASAPAFNNVGGTFHLATGSEIIDTEVASALNTRYLLAYDAQNGTFNVKDVDSDTTLVNQTNIVTDSNSYRNAWYRLFGNPRGTNNSDYSYNSRVYSAKIYDNGVLVRDMIPVRRNSDGVLGMYDLANNVFYTNSSSSGSFIAGADVGGVCVDAGVGHWTAPVAINFGSAGTNNACPIGTSTTNGTSASSCTDCAGATYNDVAGGACKSCPTGYTSNTTAGKTSESQCQISCSAGTWNGEYTKLEYLKTDGNAYINTGYAPTSENQRGLLGVMHEGGTPIILSDAAAGNGYEFQFVSPKYFLYPLASGNSGRLLASGSFSSGTRYDFEYEISGAYQSITVGGTNQVSNTGGIRTSFGNNLCLFGAPSSKMVGRIYYYKLYEDDVLVLDMIPVRRNSDGALGMINKVTGAFLTNAGTGAFIAGPDDGVFSGQCVDAGAGYWAGAAVSGYGLTPSRNACPIGTYNDTTNATSAAACVDCAGATYNDETGMGACKSCPTGYVANTTAGKTSANQCQISCSAGTYAMSNSASSNIVADAVTIPGDYEPLEYIESTGTQYIDTGIQVKENTYAEFEYQYTSTSGKNYVFGQVGGSDGKIMGWRSNRIWWFAYTDVSLLDTLKHSVDFKSDGKVYFDGDVVANRGTFSGSQSETILLFAERNDNNTINKGKVRIYKFILKEGGSDVGNYVPVRRNSDGVLGMYDLVNNEFLTNAGTGTFVAGETLIPSCVNAGAGYYAAAAVTNYGTLGTRNACPVGTYNPIETAGSVSDCLSCPAATYNNSTAAAVCTACPAGYDYGSETGKTAVNQCQIQCPAGSYISDHYTRLNYIESTGTQYINTDYYANPDTKVWMDFQLTSARENQDIFGAYWTTRSCLAFYAGTGYSNGKFREGSFSLAMGGIEQHYSNEPTDTERHQLVLSAQNHVESWTGITFPDTLNDGTTLVSELTSTNTSCAPIKIFASSYNQTSPTADGTGKSSMKLYGFKIWDGNVLVHDLIPVQRNSDNEIGLYDEVTNEFLTNAGTGTFVAGPVDGTLCEKVGTGYWSAISSVMNYGSSLTSSKNACPIGKYSPVVNGASSAACLSCAGATYNDETAQAACKTCPSGYDYNTTSGKTKISQCQAHCDAGQYIPTEGNVYTPVEYIESDGSSYIDTGYTPNQNTEIIAKTLATTTGRYIYGVTSSGNSTSLTAYVSSSGYWRFKNKYVSVSNSSVYTLNTPHDSVQNSSGVWIDNTQIGTYSDITSFTAPYTLILFGANGSSISKSSGVRIYSFEIKENNETIMNLIPVKDSNNEYGMFDTVTGQFFTNSGTGTFTGGNATGDSFGGAQCTNVGTGYYAPASTLNYGATGSKNACPIGTYSGIETGASLSDCLACPAATYNGSTAAASCTACPTGYNYGNATGNTSINQCQIQCNAGTYVSGEQTATAPSGYTLVEYLETDANGNQYIDTGYTITSQNIRGQIRAGVSSLDDAHGSLDIIGNLNGVSSSDGFTIGVGNNDNRIFMYAKTRSSAYRMNTVATTNTPYDINYVFSGDNRTLTVGEETISDNDGTNTPAAGNLMLFRGHNYDSANTFKNGRIYGFTLYEDDVLVRDMIPVRRNSDNVLGMYDKVSGTFFTNAGTGTFIAGPDDGTQCANVGTGYYATSSITNYGSTGTKSACPIGTYSGIETAGSLSDCLSCPGGTYNGSTAAAACTACPAGYDYNGATGNTSINQCQIQCPGGTYVGGPVGSNYTQLAYIQSVASSGSGSTYINTGYVVQEDDEIEIEYEITQPTAAQYQTIVGTKVTASADPLIWVFNYKSGSTYRWYSRFGSTANKSATFTPSSESKGTLVLKKSSLTINGTSRGAPVFSSMPEQPLLLFATLNSSGTVYRPSYGLRISEVRIKNNGDIVHKWVACKNSSNQVGMCDVVGGEFLANAGNSNFVAGPELGQFGTCSDVGAGYYAASSITNYGQSGARNMCPAGTYTVGYGHGADEANDCGRILHLGDSVIYARKNKPTTPALNIRMDNGDMYYIGLSTTDHTVSRLHFQTGDTKYTAFDDSLFYGERDYDTGEKITQ